MDKKDVYLYQFSPDEKRKEVEKFLKEVKIRMGVGGVLFIDERGKNSQALADLEITPKQREKFLMGLKSVDYSEGPLEETLYGGGNMWVFGIMVKKAEVYVKIAIANSGCKTICISFHPASRKMQYPLKN